jgi:hypothetical protein
MRTLVLSLVLAAVTTAAQAAPRNGYAPYARIEEPRSPPLVSGGKPFKPYKPFSVYGDDPTSLAPSRTPHYVPGYKPYTPPFREKNDPYGRSGGTFGSGRGTF